MASAASAKTSNCDLNCMRNLGYQSLEKSVSESAKSDSLAQDSQCPVQGYNFVKNVGSNQGSFLSISNMVTKQIMINEKNIERLKFDKSKCGKCIQNNKISNVNFVSPMNPSRNNSCENRDSATIQIIKNTKAEIETFSSDTLSGSNQEGQKLNAQCPNPCAFYVTSAQTPLKNGKIQLTLNVQCGQPRSGYFATYLVESSYIHEWSCSKD